MDDGFFLTMAGLSLSFIGFTGLLSALRRAGDAWAPIELFQLRLIVAYAMATLFGSLSLLPVIALFGARGGIQWLGGAMLVTCGAIAASTIRRDMRQGHGIALPTRVRALFTAIAFIGLLALLATVVTGEPAVYAVALVLLIAMPAGTFAYVVFRIGR